MSNHTEAELAAMRERWALNRAKQDAVAPRAVTVKELAILIDDELAQRKAEWLRVAKRQRTLQAEAAAAGHKDIAGALGMHAALHERDAALAEAERRDRAARPALKRDKATQDGRRKGGREKRAKLPPADDLRAEVAELQAARNITEVDAKGIVRQRYRATAQAVNRKLKKT